MFPAASRRIAVLRFLSSLLLLALLLAAGLAASAQDGPFRTRGNPAIPPLSEGSWRFIVSGDSRNCGDIVMPAIAANSVQFYPSFYWHLGDLRAIYKIDEDIAFGAANDGNFLSCSLYLPRAWPDFIDHQIAAFGNLPFYVGIGNHEVMTPKDKFQFRRQFAAWLDQKSLHDQRVKDEASQSPAASDKKTKKKTDELSEPPLPQTYYHWIQKGVDFIYLDNSSDCFPVSQLAWLDGVLQRATTDNEVKSLVVGMHESLPDSVANSHSMGDSSVIGARDSGTKAYEKLLAFHTQTTKPVYVLSSHSHFYLENIFDTPELKKKGDPLPGWIVGTGGAERYALPVQPSETAKQDVYGYLVGTVAADGTIQFVFQEIREQDLPATVRRDYPQTLVRWCFAHNSKNTDPGAGEITPHCAPPPSSEPQKCEP
ncbi:MAG: hypothetical protein ABSG72_05540 [Candidatus Sulfotelmatobacter sp.]|jgi:hypothetical protein